MTVEDKITAVYSWLLSSLRIVDVVPFFHVRHSGVNVVVCAGYEMGRLCLEIVVIKKKFSRYNE